MRSRRPSLIAGGTAVALLALAGVAAFGSSGPTAQQLQAEAAEASIGHTAGAYAGMAFAMSTGEAAGQLAPAAPTAPEPETEVLSGSLEARDETGAAGGTIATPDSGWLSQVEVRALVSAYFEPADVNRAVRIAWCESRFDPSSVDLRTGGIGLFHHLPRYWEDRASAAGFPGADPTDPTASVAAAAWEVYDGGGWDVFTCQG